jgi:hypothetical protein
LRRKFCPRKCGPSRTGAALRSLCASALQSFAQIHFQSSRCVLSGCPGLPTSRGHRLCRPSRARRTCPHCTTPERCLSACSWCWVARASSRQPAPPSRSTHLLSSGRVAAARPSGSEADPGAGWGAGCAFGARREGAGLPFAPQCKATRPGPRSPGGRARRESRRPGAGKAAQSVGAGPRASNGSNDCIGEPRRGGWSRGGGRAAAVRWRRRRRRGSLCAADLCAPAPRRLPPPCPPAPPRRRPAGAPHAAAQPRRWSH